MSCHAPAFEPGQLVPGCPGDTGVAMSATFDIRLTLARVKLTLDICNLSQWSHVTKYQH